MLVNNWRKCRKVLFSIVISIKAEDFVCMAKPVQHRATPLCAGPLALARVRAHALKIAQDCSKSRLQRGSQCAVPERCQEALDTHCMFGFAFIFPLLYIQRNFYCCSIPPHSWLHGFTWSHKPKFVSLGYRKPESSGSGKAKLSAVKGKN